MMRSARWLYGVGSVLLLIGFPACGVLVGARGIDNNHWAYFAASASLLGLTLLILGGILWLVGTHRQ
jgi:hypothetical protein